ncbi:serine/threonine protein kinase [Myxococcota bacterium]|nr:serine/threonine protein kinase [Myxococcota bacterium]
MSTAALSDGRIGRYKLIKRLAAGGMADIYLAQETSPRGYVRTVVVKTIRSDLVDEEELISMLMEEARIASCLEHDNIVRLYEVGEERGTHYLAMEFVFGRDLGQIRDRCEELGQRIPFEHVATILGDVLDALYYAHHDAKYQGKPLAVIHRDVSPQNILVGFDGSVKLLDFGLAKAAAQLSRTRAGVLKGKYAYMSPEQVNFEGVDQRADIFSVGIVLWEMLTQRRLFYRNSDYETVKAVMACLVPFPRTIRKDVPWSHAWVAYRALRRNPRWRYADATRMRAALRRNDARSREVAHDELAEWMGQLFHEELQLREHALVRAFSDPGKRREIQDAGFELIEEATEPHVELPASRSSKKRTPSSRWSSVPAGLVGLVVRTLGTWKWFILVMGAIVFLGVATGVYLGASQSYGYISVSAGSPDVHVVIGGKPVGRVPVEDVPILPGRYQVVGSVGDETEVIEVDVEAGQREQVRIPLPRRARSPARE